MRTSVWGNAYLREGKDVDIFMCCWTKTDIAKKMPAPGDADIYDKVTQFCGICVFRARQ